MRSARRMVAALLAAGALVALPAGAAVAAARPVLRLHDPRIAEASGIAVAERERGVIFVQNDSGDTNRFFAVNRRTGVTVATIRVPGARNVDWEDIATARDAAGVPSVWLADIGDNDANRPDVQLYRIPEPRVDTHRPSRVIRSVAADVWRLRYPGGPTDAESLAVGPGGEAYLVTKSLLGTSDVYAVPASPSARVRTVRRVGVVRLVPHGLPNRFGPAGELLATGAALSPDGRLFAVRTYASAYVWSVGRGGMTAALRRPPARVALPRERQGEGVTFDGSQLLVDSEGRDAPVYAVPLPHALLDAAGAARAVHTPSRAAASSPRPSSPPSPGGSSSPTPGRPKRTAGTVVIGIIVLLLAAGTSVLFQLRRSRRARRDDPPP